MPLWPSGAQGKDGISYLRNTIACGIKTLLTLAYKSEILKQTETESLDEALTKLKGI